MIKVVDVCACVEVEVRCGRCGWLLLWCGLLSDRSLGVVMCAMFSHVFSYVNVVQCVMCLLCWHGV